MPDCYPTATPNSRRRGPTTPASCSPLLHWPFVCKNENKNGDVGLSARKLGAGLWQLLWVGEVSGGGRALSLNSICGSCHHGLKFKHGSSFPPPKSMMEGATKWDPRCSRIPNSNHVYCFYNHMKLLKDQVSAVYVTSTMQAELVRAQLRIHKLEVECESSKKKLEQLLRKHGKDNPKIHVVMEDLKKELNQEKKNCKRMEILKCRLGNELANVKSAAKKVRQDYEDERNAREGLEKFCKELANKIAEGRAEVEAMNTECVKIQEEVEEERRMMQQAEMWREERVHMKLIDARLALEDKYCQMSKLVRELEAFLSSGSAASLDLRKTELIRQATISLNVKDIKEFKYVPPKAGDIYSIYDGFRQIEANERGIEPRDNHSPASDVSKVQSSNSAVTDYNNQNLLKHSNVFVDDNCSVDESAIGRKTSTHPEGQGSKYPPKGSNVTVHRQLSRGESALQVARECNENAGQQYSPNTEISDVRSEEQLMQKASSSTSKLWRSGPRNGKCRSMTPDNSNGRLINATISRLGRTPKRKSCNGRLVNQKFAEQRGSLDLANPHVTRGMKGHIEWPKGNQKNCLKAKLLEARTETQKAQLRNVLKQKA